MTRALMIAAPRSGSGKTTVDARPLARVQAPRRRRRRPQVRPRLHRSGLSRRGVGARGRQSRFLGHAAQASGRARRAGGGEKRACALRSLDGPVRRRSGGERAQRRLGRRRRRARPAGPARPRRLGAGAVGGGGGQGLRDLTTRGSASPASSSIASAASAIAGSSSKRSRRSGIPVLGALPRNDKVALPERHLGLVQAGETHALEARLDAIADFVETHVDCGRVLALAGELEWRFADARPSRASAAGTADRARSRRRVFVHLPSSSARLARGGGRDRLVLAARRRAAAGRLRPLPGFRAAIRNCMPVGLRRRRAFARA